MFNCLFAKKFGSQSNAIGNPNYQELKQTFFSQFELENLLQLYESICEKDGKLLEEVIQKLPEFAFLPFAKLVFKYEYLKIQEPLDFKGFVNILNNFSLKNSEEEKIKCEL